MSSDDWEQHKSIIVLLYSIEREPLQRIVSYMKENHNFDKKISQYEYRLKKWGVKKNAPKEVWSYVAHRIQQKKKIGKRSKVMLYGVPVPEAKLRREIQRSATIPTAMPSPKTPEEGIVCIRSPSVVDIELYWPESLPWFQFEHNFLAQALHQLSSLLPAFLAEHGPDTRIYKLREFEILLSPFLASRNPLMLRKAVSSHYNSVPKNQQHDNPQAAARVLAENSHSLAINMLKVVFFHLSNNNTEEILGLAGRESCDRFILRLVELLSHNQPQILSGLLLDPCRTASVMREALYKSAIRERNYAIITRLLESGVDPNLPMEFASIDLLRRNFRRGKLEMELRVDKRNFRGIDIAAIRADTRLGKILLHAGANVGITDHNDIPPLTLVGLDWEKLDSDDALEFARLLTERGATVNPPTTLCRHGGRRTFSPLELAVARHDDKLADFLMEQGANRTLYTCSQIKCPCSMRHGWHSLQLRPFGARCSPLLIAIVVGHIEMTRRLLQTILSQPTQVSLYFIRDLLIASCLAGDAERVSSLLSLEIDLNNNWVDGITPLVATAWNPNVGISERLLISGASIGPEQSDGDKDGQISVPTPMHVAAFNGNTELVRSLIDRGVNCNLCYARSDGNRDHLINWLLPPGLSSPLHLALMSRNVQTAALLLPYSTFLGSDLAHTTSLGDKDIVSELVSRGADILFADEYGKTALEVAMEKGNEETLSLFFASGGQYRSSALYRAAELAAESKDYYLVEMLTNNRPVGLIDSVEASCLVLAFQEGEWDLVDKLLSSFLPGPSQSFYLPCGIDIYYLCTRPGFRALPNRGYGITPLWAAYLSGNVSYIEAMIRMGYTLQKGDMESFGQLISYNSKRTEAIQALLASTCQLESTSVTYRQMLLLSAIKSYDIQRTQRYIDLIDTLDFPFGHLNRDTLETPLGLAVQLNHCELARQLIDAGANVEYTPSRLSPLQLAASLGYVEMAKILIGRGANVNRPAHLHWGATALQFSAIKGHLGLAKILIEHDADINAPPAKQCGSTALEGASKHGRLDMVEFLLRMGARVTEDMRIYYVRSVGSAMSKGHYTIAAYLKEYGSWAERDRLLYDRPGTRDCEVHFRYDTESDDWHIRWMCWPIDGHPYSVGSSDASSVEDGIIDHIQEEEEEVGVVVHDGDYRTSRVIEEWIRDATIASDEDARLTVLQRDEANDQPASLRSEGDRIISEDHMPSTRHNEDEDVSLMEMVELDCETLLGADKVDIESESTVAERQCSVVEGRGLDVPAVSSKGLAPWGDPFLGAEEPQNIWDI
ncbi:ankyrin repeat-containing domain protein [Xylaria sp. FL0043]|nr:ankyrin repeat-containing domain protein [Xylaria sp. FL0043]